MVLIELKKTTSVFGRLSGYFILAFVQPLLAVQCVFQLPFGPDLLTETELTHANTTKTFSNGLPNFILAI